MDRWWLANSGSRVPFPLMQLPLWANLLSCLCGPASSCLLQGLAPFVPFPFWSFGTGTRAYSSRARFVCFSSSNFVISPPRRTRSTSARIVRPDSTRRTRIGGFPSLRPSPSSSTRETVRFPCTPLLQLFSLDHHRSWVPEMPTESGYPSVALLILHVVASNGLWHPVVTQ